MGKLARSYNAARFASTLAMLAGAGIAIGAAWGGMLGNFAAGAFRLVLRPFKVGDFRTLGIAWQYTFFD